MTTLVDTSVWSLLLRKKGPADHWAVKTLVARIEGREPIVITGLILQEVLAYFRDDATAERVARRLDPFPLLEPTRREHEGAAALLRRARAAGVTATPIDCLIATLAISRACVLLTDDGDFAHLTELSDLKLVARP
ncbi:MAG: PIN domain-containing protein [Deltaproteobacteria bacterium]|nr:PIN domain-containing protein [Deltaproteobacteria bacterium]